MPHSNQTSSASNTLPRYGVAKAARTKLARLVHGKTEPLPGTNETIISWGMGLKACHVYEYVICPFR